MTRQHDATAAWKVGQTPGYQAFVTDWAGDRAGPPLDFITRLDLTIQEEIAAALGAAGRDLVDHVGRLLDKDRTRWQALDKLLVDLDVHLAADLATGDDAAGPLLTRVRRARVVLGLVPEPSTEGGVPG